MNLNLRPAIVFLILITLILQPPAFGVVQPQPDSLSGNISKDKEGPPFALDHFIVKLKEGRTLEDLESVNQKNGVISVEPLFPEQPSPQETLSRLKTERFELDQKGSEEDFKQEKESLDQRIGALEDLMFRLNRRQRRAEGSEPVLLERIYVVNVPEQASAEDLLAKVAVYKAHPAVEYSEPDHIVTVQALPNDTYADPNRSGVWSRGAWGQSYADLWGLEKIAVEQAWNLFARDGRPGYEFAGDGVVVAVVDTGIGYSHPDLANNMWYNFAEIPGNGIDDDANGFTDDWLGWNFSADNNDPDDRFGHGTHVAGTIAATGNNGQGVVGVAPKAKVMAIKGLNDSGVGFLSQLAAGLRYSVNNGADVLNNSWGGYFYHDPLLAEVFAYAWSRGCVSVAAAGNDNDDMMITSPANISRVIAVAATTQDDRKTFFSSYGEPRVLSPGVAVAAPGGGYANESRLGQNILSTIRDGSLMATQGRRVAPNYYVWQGTSMASPVVAGVAALLLSHNSNYSNFEVAGRISSGAVNIDSLNPQYRGKLGSGRVNAYQSLVGNTFPILKILEVKPDHLVRAGANLEVFLTLRNTGTLARNVRAVLTSTSSYVTIRNGLSKFGSMNWSDQARNKLPFLISISSSLPPSVTTLPFSLRITMSNGPELIHNFEWNVNAPFLAWTTVINGINSSVAPAVEDLNGDGAKEIVVALDGGGGGARGKGTVAVLDSNGRMMPGWPVDPDPDAPEILHSLALGDMNQDGLKDIVVTSLWRIEDPFARTVIYAYDFRGRLLENFPFVFFFFAAL